MLVENTRVSHPDQLELDFNQPAPQGVPAAEVTKSGFLQQLQNPVARLAANQHLIAKINEQISTLQASPNWMTPLRVKELEARLWALNLEQQTLRPKTTEA